MARNTNSKRRSFFKAIGGGIAAGVALALPARAKPKASGKGKPRYTMVMDARKCIGCMACVAACKAENNVPLGFTRTRVEDREVGTYPDVHRVFVPQICHQCEDAPCVPVCPVNATYRDPDGLVVIDQKECIACGRCVKACPYGARYINPIADVADKCDLCESRRKDGLQPACVEVCPTQARVFGMTGQKDGRFGRLSARPDAKVLKPEAGTSPTVKYVGL